MNKTNKTLIWLDDIRNPDENNWLKYSPINSTYNVVWLKSFSEFTNWILENGLPAGICFDHDLGIDEAGEKNGHDCAKWLVDFCLDKNMPLPLWNIQSANPVGKENIDGILRSYKKYFERKEILKDR